jgi:hypothetical protein
MLVLVVGSSTASGIFQMRKRHSAFSLAGMDYLCGRLVTYDEIPGDFASESNDRIEYYKSISVSRTL